VQVAARIFKAYDIRGVVGQTIDETFAEHLGRAFGSEALAVGREGGGGGPRRPAVGPGAGGGADPRPEGSTGLDVVDLGAVTTPMLYYVAATRGKHGCNSGIQVTGSHNPKDYNGFKMVLAGRAIYGDDIQRLRQRIEPRTYARAGRSAADGHRPEYSRRIVGDCKLARPDEDRGRLGQRHSGCIAPAILRALGCEVIDLYSEVDGDFPNHHPDPSKPENLADLIKAVHATDAELGLAFDGDGDRLGVVTKDGNIIYPDRQIMLFARDVLSRNPGGTIIFDVKCSQRCRWPSAKPAACR
jgi:phosphomannomutase